MTAPESRARAQFILYPSLSCVLCVAAGLVVFGTRIFDPHSTTFQLVVTSLMGGLLAASARRHSWPRFVFLTAGLFTVSVAMMGGALRADAWIRSLVYVAALVASVRLGLRILGENPGRSWACLVWAGVFTLLWMSALGIMVLVTGLTPSAQDVAGIAGIAMILGLGTGAAVQLTDSWLTAHR